MHLRKSLIYDSMNQLYILLLALWSAFNSFDAWDPDEHTTADPWQRSMSESHQPLTTVEETEYEKFWKDFEYEYELESDSMIPTAPDVPEPNITVYRQMEDREHVFVLCKFAEMFGMTHRRQSFQLSVESELNYTIEPLEFFPFYYSDLHVYMVTVSPPASFTCVHEIGFDLDVRNLSSQTYNYSGSVSDHHEEGASSLYICFSSFIAVGLSIMTAAVIVTNIRSKTKDTNSDAVTDNDYVEA
ncbi:uncharacterized protein LOC131545815 [Onychostoma macrolepis]|uniref:Uncharacterized protein n=1 Tax=Onychostoma macrolepis TaxID=369639 RepID=A0A7J6CT06_9TELE|nr:uncharacterized protein LOC131545815 [Onychostoma macrolepis]KAF4110390.1 hypothetical protein G5714_009642 [Onychostoma macrolepis]